MTIIFRHFHWYTSARRHIIYLERSKLKNVEEESIVYNYALQSDLKAEGPPTFSDYLVRCVYNFCRLSSNKKTTNISATAYLWLGLNNKMKKKTKFGEKECLVSSNQSSILHIHYYYDQKNTLKFRLIYFLLYVIDLEYYDFRW